MTCSQTASEQVLQTKSGRQVIPEIRKRDGKSRMAELGSEMQKPQGGEIDWSTADVGVLKFSLWYLVSQLAIASTGSRSLCSHQIWKSANQFMRLLPAQIRLRRRLRSSRALPWPDQWSRVFAGVRHLFRFAFASRRFFVGLCGLLFSGKFKNLPWRQIGATKYAVLLFVSAFGVFEIYFFLAGPSSLRNYLGIFGTDFITSVSFLLPAGQFLLLERSRFITRSRKVWPENQDNRKAGSRCLHWRR